MTSCIRFDPMETSWKDTGIVVMVGLFEGACAFEMTNSHSGADILSTEL